MWDRRKIQDKWRYFHRQRKTPTGNFTEFVVRTYYAIYDHCRAGGGASCPAAAVRNRNICRFVYHGIYDQPDHDYDHVIEDCKKNLREMGYIRLSEDKQTVFLDRPLDFLLEGEHEKYLAMLDIEDGKPSASDAPPDVPEPPEAPGAVRCPSCGGPMVLRRGKYGLFFGCGMFPKCRGTLSVADGTYALLQRDGLALYRFNRPCWKCAAPLELKSYFPLLDFKQSAPDLAEKLKALYVIRLSTLPALDDYLAEQYEQLQERFSKQAGFSYVANICPHCNALQGSLMTLSHVYDALDALPVEKLQKSVFIRVAVNEATLSREEWTEAVELLLQREKENE